jgi:hypothetical protein
MTVSIPLYPNERMKLEVVCGPHRRIKRGEWVREAVLEKLARDAPVSSKRSKESA